MARNFLTLVCFCVAACVPVLVQSASFTGSYQPAVQYDNNIFDGVQMASAPGNVAITSGAGPNDLNLTLTFNSQMVSVPLVISGNTAALASANYDIGTANVLGVMMLTDGNNMALAYVQQQKSGTAPLPISLAVAVWQRNPAAVNPGALVGNWRTTVGYGNRNLRNIPLGEGFGPQSNHFFNFSKSGGLFTANYGQGGFSVTVSVSEVSLLASPVATSDAIVHIFSLVHDNVGNGAFVFVATEPNDPTDVSIFLAPVTRTLSSATNALLLRRDFDGNDGKSDIVWQHSDGSTALWLMNGLNLSSGGLLSEATSGLRVKQIGDFNGDGKSDILWQHSDGSTVLWLMDGLSHTSSSVLIGAGSGWSVNQIGDFNGDGKSDILWRHTNGTTVLWLMDGLNLTGSQLLIGAGSGWSVKQIGDFNGDGKSDIVWEHTSGNTVLWLMDGLNLTGSTLLLGAGSGWSLNQIGDFNGDGKHDILWRHTDGTTALWLMDGLNLISGGLLSEAVSALSVLQIGDFNGDGRSDILWQHSDGSTVVWLMDGLTRTSSSVLIGAASGWSVKQLGDYNGDGKSDILWQHTSGNSVVWLMDGLNLASSGLLIGADSGWTPFMSSEPFKALAARMTTTRIFHTATLLQNGQVLITGGLLDSSFVALDSAELYDPATNTFAPIAGKMNSRRNQHGATLLANGQVLITGGSDNGNGDGLNTAELYNPATQTFSLLTETLSTPRAGHEATLLQNGQVLLTGGFFNSSVSLNSAELYNPATQTFTPVVGTMTSHRANHAASLLPSGQVLLTGGGSSHIQENTAELYNSATQTFTVLPATMTSIRAGHTSTLHSNGVVLVAGGVNNFAINNFTSFNSAEVYDPVAGSFTALADTLTTSRAGHTATMLSNGVVLLTGGGTGYLSTLSALDTAEMYKP